MVYPADVAAVPGFLRRRHRAGNGVRIYHHADPQLAGDHAAQHGADVSALRLYAPQRGAENGDAGLDEDEPDHAGAVVRPGHHPRAGRVYRRDDAALCHRPGAVNPRRDPGDGGQDCGELKYLKISLM